jgi:glutamate racemase
MEQPIGFFDSGVGGLTIWDAVNQVLPNENTVYLADSAHAPYGEKSPQQIVERSLAASKFLLENHHCKLIVVACNTATTNAIQVLRETYCVPFIGIEPAVKPAALSTKTKSIGVLATKGTLTSALFQKTANQFARNNEIAVVEVIGEGLVKLIENPNRDSAALHTLLQQYIQPMQMAQVDFIVLGCTHYPIIKKEISDIAGEAIRILDSALPVAQQTKKIVKKQKIYKYPIFPVSL